MKKRALQLVFIGLGIGALTWMSRVPSDYVSANALVAAHERINPRTGADLVAVVEFEDLRGFPRREKTRDSVLWGQPAIGETIEIYYDPSVPSVVRIAAPLNRIGGLFIMGAIMLIMFIWVCFSKNRNEK
jgi:hypothetical protein